MFNVVRILSPLSKSNLIKCVFSFSKRSELIVTRTMAQKSITSFFTKAPAKIVIKKEECISPIKNAYVDNEDSCSPVKIGSRGSKRFRIESDSDSDSPPDKKTSSETCETEDIPKKSDTTIKKEDKDNMVCSPNEKTKVSTKTNGHNTSLNGKEKTKKDKKNRSPVEKKSSKMENININNTKKKETKVKSKSDSKNVSVNSSKKNVGKDSRRESDSKTDEKNYKSDESEAEKMDTSSDLLNKTNDSETTPKDEKKPQTFHSFFSSTKTSKASDDKKDSIKLGLEYMPSKTNYHPIDDAMWKRNERVPYLALARTLEEIEKISARLKIVDLLSNFFRSVIVLTPNDLLPSVYLCLNRLAPAYENVELGVAETTLIKAIAQSTGRSVSQIKNDCNTTGDLGLVAERSRSNQRMMIVPAPLTVRGVFDKLKDIAQMTGHASMAKKVDKIQSMFIACRHSEARFLIRSLAGKLRVGLAEQSVLQALAQACTMTPPLNTRDEKEWTPKKLNASKGITPEQFKAMVDEQALILKTTYCECPNYDQIIGVLLEHGVAELPNHCRLTPGVPLKPMLAHPTKGVQEVLHRFENVEFTCEWKYDGERAQIHVPSKESEGGEVVSNISRASIYSRNQENNTSKYPDILNRLERALKDTVQSCVLDCEAVAWDKEKKHILPFQVLSTRKKKDANEADIKVDVCVFMFDLLYLNGEALVKKPFEERRKLLREHFKEVEGEWHMATSLDCSTVESIQEFLEESVKGNCEGLMVKTLNGKDATYEIAKRSRNWLKLKKDYLEGVGDTIDAVVIGGYLGRGKRAGVYGGFLLACYDKQSDEYQSLCKIGTGFSDQDLQDHSKSLAEHIIQAPKGYYRYDSSLEPDHWFDAVQVWEVKCADLSLSPIHRAAMGIVDAEKGISLRFPRFIRVREDKTSEDATSAQQIAELYCNQDQVKNQSQKVNKNFEDDFY